MMTKKHKFPGKKLLVLALAAVLAAGLSGCHGAKEQSAFSIPEEFDTSKNYEITFWAKNDTNKTQTEIYKRLSPISKPCTPTLLWICGFITLREDLQ